MPISNFKFEDIIYGEIITGVPPDILSVPLTTVGEPLILDLIESKELQRLKDIDQGGYPLLHFNPNSVPISELKRNNRFEHSLGVYFLLRKFNAPFKEQVAGLIHDVSHSAFSHAIDYVLDSGSPKKQSQQDDIFEAFIKKSEIPAIFKKYNLDLNYFLDKENFPFLEKPLPELCADRIDYSLRTAVVFKEINQEEARYFLDNLIIEEKNWVFKNFESAQKYTQLFVRLNNFYYAGIYTAAMFKAVGDTLRYSLKKSYLSTEDLYTTDEKVLNKIKRYLDDDRELKLLFDRMNNKVKFRNDPQSSADRIFCKSRAVDPLFLENGQVKRISQADSKWKEMLVRELMPKEYFIKFEK